MIENMSDLENKETEEIILEAAKKVFIDKGLTGARMQEIADEAKINKSLLHYYYRTKEKLFGAVFNAVVGKFLPNTLNIIKTDKSFFEKIEVFVCDYITLLQKNSTIPNFILSEVNRNPNGIPNLMMNVVNSLGFNVVETFIKMVDDEVKKGTIKPIDARQLFVNILSLCIFPFIGKPIIMKIGFNDDEILYKRFIEDRKTEISKFVINSIKI